MNAHPMPEPVAGQPFEPFCRFGVCEDDDQHVPTCPKHPDRAQHQREEATA